MGEYTICAVKKQPEAYVIDEFIKELIFLSI